MTVRPGHQEEYGKPAPCPGAFRSFLLDQLLLQRTAFKRDPRALKGEERADFLRWNHLAAFRELGELLDKVRGWKPWDQVNRGAVAGEPIDRDALIDEAVDVLHFIGNILLTADVTDKELSDAFAAKQDKNRQRQKSGVYDGDGEKFDGLLATIIPGEPAEDYK